MKKWIKVSLWTLCGLAVAVQLVPYGRDHTNPPGRTEPAWNAPETRAFAVRACYDCHSDEVRWPWYANIAPMSWLVQHDVDEARGDLNFSEWGRARNRGHEAAEEVEEGEMPPSQYLLMHGDARLTPKEREAFVEGLRATFGEDDGHRRGRGR